MGSLCSFPPQNVKKCGENAIAYDWQRREYTATGFQAFLQ